MSHHNGIGQGQVREKCGSYTTHPPQHTLLFKLSYFTVLLSFGIKQHVNAQKKSVHSEWGQVSAPIDPSTPIVLLYRKMNKIKVLPNLLIIFQYLKEICMIRAVLGICVPSCAGK